MGLNSDGTSSPIKFTPSKDSSYRSGDDKTGPSGDATSRKDFRKVLDKSDDDEGGGDQAAKSVKEEGEIAENKAIAELGKKRGAMSLFDLTSGKSMLSTDGKAATAHTGVDSPNTLFSKISGVEGKKAGGNGMAKGLSDEMPVEGTVYVEAPEKGKFTTRFATEQSDLSSVNPLAVAAPALDHSVAVKTDTPVMPVRNIQEIINQMIDKVNEIKTDGRTETVVTLKHPPMFANATIVVTAFDSAKGEFNISFENLTQAAQNLLNMQANRDSLLHALEQRGYNVHILIATTLTESRPVVEEPKQGGQFAQDQSAQDQERRQGREGKRDQA